jgi:hypothetical protein
MADVASVTCGALWRGTLTMLANAPICGAVPTYELQGAKRCYVEVYSDHSGFKRMWLKDPDDSILSSN